MSFSFTMFSPIQGLLCCLGWSEINSWTCTFFLPLTLKDHSKAHTHLTFTKSNTSGKAQCGDSKCGLPRQAECPDCTYYSFSSMLPSKPTDMAMSSLRFQLFETVSCCPGSHVVPNSPCSQGLWSSNLHLPSAGIIDLDHHVWFYTVLGIKIRASCMLARLCIK